MKALVAAAFDSLPTSITWLAADRLATLLESKGVTVYRFEAWKSSQPLVALQLLMTPDIDFICYFGHGANDRLHGQLPGGMFIPLLDLINKGLIQGKIVYTVACDSGRQLGPESGAQAYFGSKDVMYVALKYPEHDYMEDFINTWTVIPLALLSGRTAQEALASYKARCTEYINLYSLHEREWPNSDEFKRMLIVNRDHYELFGNPSAKLSA